MKSCVLALLLASPLLAQVSQDDFTVHVHAQFEDLPYTTYADTPLPIDLPIRGARARIQVQGVLQPTWAVLDDDGRCSVTFENLVGPRDVTVTVFAEDGQGRAEVRSYHWEPDDDGLLFPVADGLHELSRNRDDLASGGTVTLKAKQGTKGPAFHILDWAQRSHDKAESWGADPCLARCCWKKGDSTVTGYFAHGIELVVIGEDVAYGDVTTPEEVGHYYQDTLFGHGGPEVEIPHDNHTNPVHAFYEGWAYWFTTQVVGGRKFVLPGFYDYDIETGLWWMPNGTFFGAYFAYGTDHEESVGMALYEMTDTHVDDNDEYWCDPALIWSVTSSLSYPATLEDFVSAHPDRDDEAFLNVLRSRVLEFVETPNTKLWTSAGGPVDIEEGQSPGGELTIATEDLSIGQFNDYAPKGMKHSSPPLCSRYDLVHEAPESLVVRLVDENLEEQLLMEHGHFGGGDPAHDALFAVPGRNTLWLDLVTQFGDYGVPPWVEPVAPGGWSLRPLGTTWFLEVDDDVVDQVTGSLAQARLWLTPQDWGDRPGGAFGAWSENTNYEWLGPRATHETELDDPRDEDGKPNDGNEDVDDGIGATYDDADRRLDITARAWTSGARDARYRAASYDPLLVRVHVWIDEDGDGFQQDERLELLPQGWSGDLELRSPVYWPIGQNHMDYELSWQLPDDLDEGVPIWFRFRLTYDDADPTPLGGAPFGEVEDYHVVPSQGIVPTFDDPGGDDL